MCPEGGGGDGEYLAAEARARKEIDSMLAAAGWTVRHQRDMNLGAALGVAVREVTLNPGHGRADYVLFVDRRAVGVIEAKAQGTPLTGVEWQSAKWLTELCDPRRGPEFFVGNQKNAPQAFMVLGIYPSGTPLGA